MKPADPQKLTSDAKLIAATNIALATAIRDASSAVQGGMPALPSEDIVLGNVRQALKSIDSLGGDLKPVEQDLF